MEKVLGKRLRNNRVEYFLKWVGYDYNENTWEPEEHLKCKALLKAFEQNLLKAKHKKQNKKIVRGKRQLSNSIVNSYASSEAGPSGTSGSSKSCSKSVTKKNLEKTDESAQAGPSRGRGRPSIPQINVKVEIPDEHRESDLAENNDNVDDTENSVSAETENNVSEATGSDTKIAERIMGVTLYHGEMAYLIKWAGLDEADLVTSTQASLICPRLIIKFFENKINWR